MDTDILSTRGIILPRYMELSGTRINWATRKLGMLSFVLCTLRLFYI